MPKVCPRCAQLDFQIAEEVNLIFQKRESNLSNNIQHRPIETQSHCNVTTKYGLTVVNHHSTTNQIDIQ